MPERIRQAMGRHTSLLICERSAVERSVPQVSITLRNPGRRAIHRTYSAKTLAIEKSVKGLAFTVG